MEIKTLKTESDFIRFIENQLETGEWNVALSYGEFAHELEKGKKGFLIVESSMHHIEEENKALYDFIDNNYEWGFQITDPFSMILSSFFWTRRTSLSHSIATVNENCVNLNTESKRIRAKSSAHLTAP